MLARPVLLALLSILVGPAPTLGAADAAVATEWSLVEGPPTARCADDSDLDYIERRADPRKVVLYFEGGGACFSAETCAFDGEETTYVSRTFVTPVDLAVRDGIFDLDQPENPLADHSFLYVPYCTGDGHLGSSTQVYSEDLTVQHWGYLNALTALDQLVSRFPEVSELVVAGSSAGGIPVPLFAGLAADRIPDASIVALADGAGAFPDLPVLNAVIGNLWGTAAAIPEWPETAGIGLDEWGIPGLWVYAGRRAPEIAFARFDYAFDETQAFYASLVGVEVDELVRLIDDIAADIEAAGVEIATYVAPGDAHTILGSDDFYELEVEDVRFVDWVRELLEGREPSDVHCRDCSAPA